jgi:hypothetical protein
VYANYSAAEYFAVARGPPFLCTDIVSIICKCLCVCCVCKIHSKQYLNFTQTFALPIASQDRLDCYV